MSNQLFEAALGMQSPWFVQGVDFDETCSKHGHNYLTLVTDMQARRVLFVTNSFNADALLARLLRQGQHPAKPECSAYE